MGESANVLVNAAFASALSLPAAILSSSETFLTLRLGRMGDAGADDSGVEALDDGDGDDGTDEDGVESAIV